MRGMRIRQSGCADDQNRRRDLRDGRRDNSRGGIERKYQPNRAAQGLSDSAGRLVSLRSACARPAERQRMAPGRTTSCRTLPLGEGSLQRWRHHGGTRRRREHQRRNHRPARGHRRRAHYCDAGTRVRRYPRSGRLLGSQATGVLASSTVQQSSNQQTLWYREEAQSPHERGVRIRSPRTSQCKGLA